MIEAGNTEQGGNNVKTATLRIIALLTAAFFVCFVPAGCQQTPGLPETTGPVSRTDPPPAATAAADNTTAAAQTAQPTQAQEMKKTVTFSKELNSAVTGALSFIGDSDTPDLTAEEKDAQKKAGRELIRDLMKNAADLSVGTYVIPAGNYGFDMDNIVNGVASGVVIKDVQRPADNPLTIRADGVNFWFEPTGKPCGSCTRGIHFVNCSHIILDGLTIDSYSPMDIEGTITSIDKAGNRLGLRLLDGAMVLDPATIAKAVGGSEFRMIPLKKSGELMASFYNVNNQWGPESLWGAGLEVDSDGTCWYTLKTRTLMDTVFADEWTSFYGKNGTLEIGDRVAILYGTALAIALDNCEQMTVRNFNCYMTKGGFWENGGYGGHLWQNCVFGTRPGTNRLLGGEGNMSQGLRHGSTYDNVSYGLTSDDAINIHGFWSRIVSAKEAAGEDSGYSCRVNYAPVGIREGDKAELYTEGGKLVGTLTVRSTPSPKYNYNGFLESNIVFNEKPPEGFDALLVRWPASECDGFVIKNCRFANDYQRVLINSGSGILENNLFIDHGSNLALTSNNAAYEGGIMQDIIIRNNVFFNACNHPGGTVVDMSQTTNWANTVSAKNLVLEDNVFVQCGKLFSASNIKELTVKNNLIIDPWIYGKTVNSFSVLAVVGEYCTVTDFSGNTAYAPGGKAVKGSNAIKTMTEEKVAQAVAVCSDKSLTASAMQKKLADLFR